jgi:hypothetical protein
MKPVQSFDQFDDAYMPFPEIGSGSQFHTFDMHNGRVLKLPLTKEETIEVLMRRKHNMNPLSSVEQASVESRMHTVINSKARIPDMIGHSFYQPEGFLRMIGNPVAVDADNVLPKDTINKQWGSGRVVYIQDKLDMIGMILNSFTELVTLGRGDILRLQRIIDQYVQRTYELWEYGFADYVFKLGDAGFDTSGRLVIADLGEFTSDPVFMKKALDDRRWLHATMANKIDFPQIPKQMQKYYTETLDNAFTHEHFVSRWKTKHSCSSCSKRDDPISVFIAAKMAEIDYVDRW